MKRSHLWVLVLCIASLLATVCILHLLPERVPLHWGANGQIDRYGARANVLITAGLPSCSTA